MVQARLVKDNTMKLMDFISFFSKLIQKLHHNPASIYLLKVNNRNIRTKCEIRSYFTLCSSVSIVNFEHVIADWEKAKLLKNTTRAYN